jgi:hypothetical protein
MSVGRGALVFDHPADHTVFGIWFREQIERHGGRKLVSERSGVSVDTISACSSARRNPARVTLVKLIEAGVIEYTTPEDLIMHRPWLDVKYERIAAKDRKRKAQAVFEAPASNGEVAQEAPAPAPVNLMDAVMAEPNLSAKQRAQLAALVAMVVNGVDIEVNIAPRR